MRRSLPAEPPPCGARSGRGGTELSVVPAWARGRSPCPACWSAAREPVPSRGAGVMSLDGQRIHSTVTRDRQTSGHLLSGGRATSLPTPVLAARSETGTCDLAELLTATSHLLMGRPSSTGAGSLLPDWDILTQFPHGAPPCPELGQRGQQSVSPESENTLTTGGPVQSSHAGPVLLWVPHQSDFPFYMEEKSPFLSDLRCLYLLDQFIVTGVKFLLIPNPDLFAIRQTCIYLWNPLPLESLVLLGVGTI
ncbi:uncharacterized protein LOC116569353 [Mustela erminea]|uniref:uncharacterized protein LOC116569353 n=1 Tax=Mustela erminea TaxID=36723 RepID=UPI001387408A|nr:uncharacterized protein LOC116569353 [Mustela erminea]